MTNTLLEDKTTKLLHHMNLWQIPYLKIRLQNFSIIWTYGKYLTWRYNYKTSPSYEPMANTLLEDKTTKLLHHMNLWQIPYLKIKLRTTANTLLHHMNRWQIPYLKIRLQNFSIIWTYAKYLTCRSDYKTSPSYEHGKYLTWR